MRNLQNFTPGKKIGKIFILIFIFTLCQKFYGPENYAQTTRNSKDLISNESLGNYSEFDLTIPFKNCWNYLYEGNDFKSVASDNAAGLYFIFSNSEIIKFNSESAQSEWKTTLGGEIISDALVTGESFYIVNKSIISNSSKDNYTGNESYSSAIRSLDKQTGITVWETKLPVSEQMYLFESSNRVICFDQNGFFYIVQKQDGKVIQTGNLSAKLTSKPVLERNFIITGLDDDSIAVISIENGKEISKVKARFPTAVTLSDFEKIIWGDRKGAVTSIYPSNVSDFKGGRKSWVFRSGAEVSNIIETPFGILISSFDNFVYLVSESRGNLLWKKRFTGRLSFKPLIIEHYAVFVTDTDPNALILDLRNGRIINKISIANDDFFVGSPLKIKDKFIFPTSKKLYAFSTLQSCGNEKAAGENDIKIR